MSNTFRSDDYQNEGHFRSRVDQRLHESAEHFARKTNNGIRDRELPTEMLEKYLLIRKLDYLSIEPEEDPITPASIVSASLSIFGVGTVVIPGSNAMVSGTTGYIKVYPKPGNVARSVVVNGTVVYGIGGVYNFSVPDADFDVVVTFAARDYSYRSQWLEESNLCSIITAVYKSWWEEPVCVQTTQLYSSGWSDQVCVELGSVYEGKWKGIVCVEEYGKYSSQWSGEICTQIESSYVGTWSTKVCVEQ